MIESNFYCNTTDIFIVTATAHLSRLLFLHAGMTVFFTLSIYSVFMCMRVYVHKYPHVQFHLPKDLNMMGFIILFYR